VKTRVLEAEASRISPLHERDQCWRGVLLPRKNHSEALAESWRESSQTLPVKIEVPSADDIWSAASLKGRFPVSFADAFAAALAQKYACPLVTGDPEFRSVDQLELDWIGGPTESA
jgi:predicted nucleic acid-binding protein